MALVEKHLLVTPLQREFVGQSVLYSQAMDAQAGFLQKAQHALGADAAPDDIRALATQYEASA